MFLDNALWNGNLTDLLLSRTAFLNSNLATTIYTVPAPAGATATTFVATTLPADQRAGLLTNAAFLTSRAPRPAATCVVPRGLLVAAALLCMPHPGPDPFAVAVSPVRGPDRAGAGRDASGAVPACRACHAQFDPYGLALENYDDFGRYRTIDDAGRPSRRARHAARRDRRRHRGERRGARAEAGGQSRLHELHGADAAAVRDGRSRRQRRAADALAAGRVRDRRRRPAVPERQRQDVHRPGPRDGGRARVRASEGGAMTSYRFRRRAFITAMSGGVGLKIMLRNLESSAQGCDRRAGCWSRTGRSGSSPGQATRCGSRRRAAWAAPRRSSRSPTRGLGPDMTVIRGLSTAPNGARRRPRSRGPSRWSPGVGAGGNAGELLRGRRRLRGAGPSFDQILLQKRARAAAAGDGYANCDRGQPHGLRGDLDEDACRTPPRSRTW